MKRASEITACVVDYGSFFTLADKLGETYKRVLYYSPFEREFQDVKYCVIGTGFANVERCDDFMDPATLAQIDLFIFPDIAWGGLQKYLRSLGKAVWGGMGASDLELYRTRFLKTIEELGMPVAPSKTVKGLLALRDHLSTVEDKWIKVNRFRANMETWHHLDMEHSLPMLNSLAVDFGGVSEKVVFVVQDPIPNAQEVGYDGFSVDGKFPKRSFQGYEKKNELYLGSWLDEVDMPDPVTMVNEALSPLLAKIGYRNFLATEIRDDYFIDPTMRMAGQTQEHLLETMTNLAEVIWAGANGELVEPEFSHKFAAEATLHYTPGTDDWMVMRVPDELRKWVKPYHCCEVDGAWHFPPHMSDEVGVVLGLGNTVEEAIDSLKEHLAGLEREPVTARIEGFADLIKEIKKAQAAGMPFSDKPLPTPASVIA